MSISDFNKKEDQKIKEKTGLKTDVELNAYFCFYFNADWEDGLIMYGNAQHEFYNQIRKGIDTLFGTYDLYGKFGEKQANVIDKKISEMADLKYESWLKYFQKKGLISKNKMKFRRSKNKYYKLLGYNPYNDPEFYIIYKKRGQKGRIPICDEILVQERIRELRNEGYDVKEPLLTK